MTRSLPSLAIILGVAGLLPFAAFALLALGPQAAGAGLGLIAYGAVILAFLGGVHWGFALIDPAGRAQSARLALGVVPSLVGWVAVLLAVALGFWEGVLLLIAGFIGTTIVEHRAAHRELMPPGYLRLRYGLSAGVVLILLAAMVLRWAGVQVVL